MKGSRPLFDGLTLGQSQLSLMAQITPRFIPSLPVT